MTRVLILGALCAVICLAGCDGPKLVKVSGRVLLDGKELSEGEFRLVPTDSSQATEATKIIDGKFEMMAKPGAKKVEIRASRPIDMTKMLAKYPGVSPQFESIIPEKYNDKTELMLDVPESGVTDKVFELTGKKK